MLIYYYDNLLLVYSIKVTDPSFLENCLPEKVPGLYWKFWEFSMYVIMEGPEPFFYLETQNRSIKSIIKKYKKIILKS